MSVRVYYPSFEYVRRQPSLFFNDVDRLLYNPFVNVRNPIDEFEIIARNLLRHSSDLKKSDDATKKEKQNDNDAINENNQPLTINLDMSEYDPKNIRVKRIGQKLIVEADEEKETEDQGFKSYSRRQFHKTINLPENVKLEDVTSALTKQGVLRITAPVLSLPPPAEEEPKEIEVRKEEEEEEVEQESSSNIPCCSTNDSTSAEQTSTTENE